MVPLVSARSSIIVVLLALAVLSVPTGAATVDLPQLDLDEIGITGGVCAEAHVVPNQGGDEPVEVGVHGSGEAKAGVDLDERGSVGGEACATVPAPCSIWILPPQPSVQCAMMWVEYLCGSLCTPIDCDCEWLALDRSSLGLV